jgi:hypothetical protein
MDGIPPVTILVHWPAVWESMVEMILRDFMSPPKYLYAAFSGGLYTL